MKYNVDDLKKPKKNVHISIFVSEKDNKCHVVPGVVNVSSGASVIFENINTDVDIVFPDGNPFDTQNANFTNEAKGIEQKEAHLKNKNVQTDKTGVWFHKKSEKYLELKIKEVKDGRDEYEYIVDCHQTDKEAIADSRPKMLIDG